MKSHPVLPLFVDDYEAATTHLTPEEDGIYSRLLRLCWRTPGCSLPNEPAWIARKVRVSLEDFDRLVQPILDEFFKVESGRVLQERLRAEFDYVSRTSRARSSAGKRGGLSKSSKTKGKTRSPATILPPTLLQQNGSTLPYPTLPTNSEDKSSAQSAGDLFDSSAPDPDKKAWDDALALLIGAGTPDKAARSFFGRLLSANKLRARDMLGSIGAAIASGTPDPQSYLTKAARGVATRSGTVNLAAVSNIQ